MLATTVLSHVANKIYFPKIQQRGTRGDVRVDYTIQTANSINVSFAGRVDGSPSAPVNEAATQVLRHESAYFLRVALRSALV
jgi:hypothetical protein